MTINWQQLKVTLKYPQVFSDPWTYIGNTPGDTQIAVQGSGAAFNSQVSPWYGTDGNTYANSGWAYNPYWGGNGCMVATGGGHGDYGGNDVFIFDLNTYQWIRASTPSPEIYPPGSAQQNDCLNWGTASFPLHPFDSANGELADKTPIATHTWSSLQCIPSVGGGGPGRLVEWACLSPCWSGASTNFIGVPTHIFDLARINWQGGQNGWLDAGGNPMRSTNSPPRRGLDGAAAEICCYDASTNRIWGAIRGTGSLLSYLDLNTMTHMGINGQPIGAGGTTVSLPDAGYNATCARVPVTIGSTKMMLIAYGDYGTTADKPFMLTAVTIGAASPQQYTLDLIGDIPPPGRNRGYGFDWDFANNRGYMYVGNCNYSTNSDNTPSPLAIMDTIWQITPPSAYPLTWSWRMRKITLPTPFPIGKSDGTLTNWRYIPGLNKFVLFTTKTNKVILWTPPTGL